MSTHAEPRLRTALLSVYHKDGLDEIARQLDALGVGLVSTGGTYDYLVSLGLQATRVEDLTGYPSIFGGRVKTLHPAVFGGILYRRELPSDVTEADQYQIPALDLVIVDLYPFEQTLASGAAPQDVIEKIDIGGVSLIRAAAKNHVDVAVVSGPDQYPELMRALQRSEPGFTEVERKGLAARALARTAQYDLAISHYLMGAPVPRAAAPLAAAIHPLRYGENPHQPAYFQGELEGLFEQLHGKELSYNNLLDLEAGLRLVHDFSQERGAGQIACAILKHNNACGLSLAATPLQAWQQALAADPVSAFGGVIVLNGTIDEATARAIDEIFYEILIAPDFTPEAIEVLTGRKNRILLRLGNYVPQMVEMRTLLNGVIVQQADLAYETGADLRPVTERAPTADELEAMVFAARVVKHTRSNAIVLARAGQLVASGMGQTSRVDALRQAIAKAKAFGLSLEGAVMASDAFFPFPDCVEIAAEAGIGAVVQPGGSVRDQDSIDACNRLGLAMCLTGRRHFKH